jgi:hypothetical protein
MDSSTYSPTNSNSDNELNSQGTELNTQEIELISPSPPIIHTIRSKKPNNINYNTSDYILEPDKDSNVYIFKYSLFKRTLQPFILEKEREILIECNK